MLLPVFAIKLIPYTTSWVKSFIIQTLERHIFYPDEGPEELSKTEDSQAMPTAPDAWAQGCVPVVKAFLGLHNTSQQVPLICLVSDTSLLSVLFTFKFICINIHIIAIIFLYPLPTDG